MLACAPHVSPGILADSLTKYPDVFHIFLSSLLGVESVFMLWEYYICVMDKKFLVVSVITFDINSY